MVAILKFRVPAAHSALGRALQVRDGIAVELESLVPSGTASIPFFWIHAEESDEIVESLREQPSVETIEAIESVDGATLVALEWDTDADAVFREIRDTGGHILQPVCRDDAWEFTVRFFGHEDLAAFKRRYEASDLSLSVDRIYHRSDRGGDLRFGLTENQREALALALEHGYYDIPRRCATADLADELGISAQAVIERLRRAISNLTRHTVLAARSIEQ